MRQEGGRVVTPLNTDPEVAGRVSGCCGIWVRSKKPSRIAWPGRAVSLRGFPEGGDAIWGERRLKHS